jgi:uncharacterized delta-60 repeat protein
MLFSSVPLRRAQADAGDLDLTFDNDGKVTTDFFGDFDSANAVVVQADNKVIAGGTTSLLGGNNDFALVRYNSNGSLDPTFGSGGKVNTDFGSLSDVILAVVIQPDGKILAAGTAVTGNISNSDFAIARYNNNGSLDLTFGSGGRVTTDFFVRDVANGIAIQPDGKIVVAGEVDDFASNHDFATARYNSDGSLDTTFGSNGKVTTNFFGSLVNVVALVINAGGKIVVAGTVTSGGPALDFMLVRYNSNGSLDATFGSGGKVTTDFFGGADFCLSLNLQSDGKLVATGDAISPMFGTILGIARYNSDGSLDPTFGVGGKSTEPVHVGSRGSVILPNGKIVAGGLSFDGTSTFDFAVARYTTDGHLDPTFGSGGVTTTNFGTTSQANAVALQPDGKVVLAGNVLGVQGFFDFALTRYEGDAPNFDICIQDDRNGNLLQFNSETGDYQFRDCRKGFTLAGRGTVRIRACKVELQDSGRDRSLTVLANTCTHVGAVSLQVASPNRSFTVSDAVITNNTCGCR